MKIQFIRRMTAPAAFVVAALIGHGDATAQKFTMKIGTATINDIQHEWMKRFQQRMHAKAGDRIKVELYPSGQLGKIPRMIEGMQLGTIESFVTPSAFLVGLDKRNQVPWAAGIFKDIDHCWRTMADDRFRNFWFPMIENKGITAISAFCADSQAFLTKKRIQRLDDMRGLKIRVLATELEIKPMRAVGINPVPIPFTEVLPALQRNVIDGMSSIPILFNNLKMYVTAKHITRTGLFTANVPVYVSKRWWDKLPGDLRALAVSESREIEKALIPWNVAANARTIESWKKNGGTVTFLPPEDQARLLDTVRPIVAEILSSDPKVSEAFQNLREVAKANE
jgi:TRAP-type C4-dicarboxylate transport system substrate-binding protein